MHRFELCINILSMQSSVTSISTHSRPVNQRIIRGHGYHPGCNGYFFGQHLPGHLVTAVSLRGKKNGLILLSEDMLITILLVFASVRCASPGIPDGPEAFVDFRIHYGTSLVFCNRNLSENLPDIV